MRLELIRPELIEKYKALHISVVIRDYKLPVDTSEITISNKYGTLVMYQTGNTFRNPSLTDKMVNLGETALAVGQGLLDGKPILASDEMITSRLAICKACPYGNGDVFCKSCGCITEAKVRLSTSHCPEGKWRSL